MANFAQALNTDLNLRLTTSVWDTNVAQWMMKTQAYVMSSGGTIWVPLTLDENGHLKASVKDSALPNGAATQATLAEVLAKIIAAPATAAKQDTLIAKDFATQTTLASILEELEKSVIKIDPTQNDVKVSGSKMELYGATVAARPAATSVAAGTTFTIVDDTQDFKTWMSNGVNWGEEI